MVIKNKTLTLIPLSLNKLLGKKNRTRQKFFNQSYGFIYFCILTKVMDLFIFIIITFVKGSH